MTLHVWLNKSKTISISLKRFKILWNVISQSLDNMEDVWKPGLARLSYNSAFLTKFQIGVQYQGKNYTGAPGDFAPEMPKRALENKKEPLKLP